MRQIFGWDRYDTDPAQAAMNDLYENELRLLQNLFQPSLKLKQKIRVGSKVIRKYDPAKTPLQRVINSGTYHRTKVKKLKTLQKTLDPFELSKTIDQKLGQIFKLASQRIHTRKQMESIQRRALDSSRTNRNETSHIQLSPAQQAYRDNFYIGRQGRWEKKTMARLKREAALYK